MKTELLKYYNSVEWKLKLENISRDNYIYLELLSNIHYEENQLNFVWFVNIDYIRNIINLINNVFINIDDFRVKKFFWRAFSELFKLGFNERKQRKYIEYEKKWLIFISNIKYKQINTEKSLDEIEKQIYDNIIKYKQFWYNILVNKSTFWNDIIEYYVLRFLDKNFKISKISIIIDEFLL